MLTSRDRIENPVPNGGTMPTVPLGQTSADYMVPSDPGTLNPAGSPLEPMTVPITIGVAGEGVGSGAATEEATVNSTPTHATNPSGWEYGSGQYRENNPPAPEPRWEGTPAGPMPPSSGGSTHPALR
jgi:hypothetical protein